MAIWKYKLHLSGEWKLVHSGYMTIRELASVVASKLKELPCYEHDYGLKNLVLDFEEFATSESEDRDEFDYIYDKLCDWGDQEVGHNPRTCLCWIGITYD